MTCAISGVRALPALDEPALIDPVFEVAGHKLTWPVTLLSGQTFTYWPDEGVRISIGEKHGPVVRFELPTTITLSPGKHAVRFTTASPLTALPSVRLTLQPAERLLVTKSGKTK